MYSCRVSYHYTNKEDILYFPRIPVKDDLVLLEAGMHKVIWVRLYAFTLDQVKYPGYPGVVAHIRLEQEN